MISICIQSNETCIPSLDNTCTHFYRPAPALQNEGESPVKHDVEVHEKYILVYYSYEALGLSVKYTQKPLNQKKIPYYIVFSYAKLVELKARILKKNEPTLKAYGVGTLALSFTLDITKAKTLLGYRPVISTKEAIDEFVKWYSSDENL